MSDVIFDDSKYGVEKGTQQEAEKGSIFDQLGLTGTTASTNAVLLGIAIVISLCAAWYYLASTLDSRPPENDILIPSVEYPVPGTRL